MTIWHRWRVSRLRKQLAALEARITRAESVLSRALRSSRYRETSRHAAQLQRLYRQVAELRHRLEQHRSRAHTAGGLR